MSLLTGTTERLERGPDSSERVPNSLEKNQLRAEENLPTALRNPWLSQGRVRGMVS